MSTQTKVVRCPRCRRIFMAAVMPQAETDLETAKEFRDYLRRGFLVEYMPTLHFRAEGMDEGPCALCVGPEELFSDGQLPLFREGA